MRAARVAAYLAGAALTALALTLAARCAQRWWQIYTDEG